MANDPDEPTLDKPDPDKDHDESKASLIGIPKD